MIIILKMNQISYISKLALILKHIKSDFSPSTVHKCYMFMPNTYGVMNSPSEYVGRTYNIFYKNKIFKTMRLELVKKIRTDFINIFRLGSSKCISSKNLFTKSNLNTVKVIFSDIIICSIRV